MKRISEPFGRYSKKVRAEHKAHARCLHKTEVKEMFVAMGYNRLFGRHLDKVPCGFMYLQAVHHQVDCDTFETHIVDPRNFVNASDLHVGGVVREILMNAQRSFPCPYSGDEDQAQHACTKSAMVLDILGGHVALSLSHDDLLEAENRAKTSASSTISTNHQTKLSSSDSFGGGRKRPPLLFCCPH